MMPTDNQLGKRKRELRDTTPPEQDYDEDGEERPYNENEEPFPAHPAFDERIKTLKTSATANMSRLLQSLAENVSASQSLLHMQKKAESALIMPDPDRLLIALVGDTGAGK
jgi:flagellar biosynthesis GTPase FlhF